jgi:type II secretory pathway predicted ATPase ExeA
MPGADLGDLFLAEQKRNVRADRTVTLDGVAFEVDAALVGERVTLRFDPARKPDKRAVEVWHQGRRIEIARRVDALANCFVKRNATTRDLEFPKDASSELPEGMAMRDLVDFDDPGRGHLLMYRKHFALTRHPFDKDLGADDLFASQSLAELGARLKHLVDMRGIGLVTGDSGSGKTTTCRHLVAGLHSGLYRVLYVSMTTGNVMDLYKSIAWELGLPTERNRAALFRQIRAEVSRLCAENRLRPVLIVDEAHHLRTELLEDLRLLTNYAMDSENRLTVVLVGHPELRRRMSMAALDALAQRIVVRAHVRGLARDEMGPYLAHRLRLAGTEVPLFEPPTVEAIFQASSGLPRKANGLAHHALFAAAIAKAKSVTTEHVQAALQEVA